MKTRHLIAEAYLHVLAFALIGVQVGLRFTRASLRSYPAGTTIFDVESHLSRVLFIESGWTISSKTMSNGTRIVTEFFLHGVVLSSAYPSMSHETVHAVSDVTCYEFQGQMSGAGSDGGSQLPLIMTIELMKRHRAGEADEQIGEGIQLTINAIATALRNSG